MKNSPIAKWALGIAGTLIVAAILGGVSAMSGYGTAIAINRTAIIEHEGDMRVLSERLDLRWGFISKELAEIKGILKERNE